MLIFQIFFLDLSSLITNEYKGKKSHKIRITVLTIYDKYMHDKPSQSFPRLQLCVQNLPLIFHSV